MMKDYTEIKEDMILRDYLAYDRTKLALTRTLLSFLRTALGLLASGVGLILLQDVVSVRIIGYLVIVTAFIVAAAGVIYCHRYRKRLDKLNESSQED